MAPQRERRILTEQTLGEGLVALAATDPDVARALDEAGPPALRRNRAGFETLLRAIVSQQISKAAAATVWERLERATRGIAPESVLALDEDALRAAGLSHRKAGYVRGLAESVMTGAIDLDGLARRPDAEVVAELVRLRGIGRWSAEIYLLFALGRPDAFPADDLALMIGAQRLKRLAARPDRGGLSEIAEAWRPWRGPAALLLWHYYTWTGR
ncbi:MAG: DNA-3-methyladenine glycosylase 2 family protein [Rhodospirillales bacterium]|nr:MAG: DNA-3-methyladenine glycosylase 2 family protein [Rhodospirillales bacterium]